jgi:phosphotriesterase-related protein
MRKLITTLGDFAAGDLGMILAHEHLFVDLGPIEAESYRHADTAEAVACMTPELAKIAAQGVTALVECTPVGVGRRADIDLAISRAANFPVVLPTGVYREPWVPAWVHDAAEEELTAWMVKELTVGIEETGVRAAWIKVSAGDNGMTDCERKILRAAGRAGIATGAVIGSHTIRGRVVLDQLAVLEEVGYGAERFIWIHTQAESDERFYDDVAARGAWLEFDAIGSPGFSDEWFIDAIGRVVEAGFGPQLLLSQDRGWYDPSKPGGGQVKPFTYLLDRFIPKLRDAGLAETWVEQMLIKNPFTAYARDDA